MDPHACLMRLLTAIREENHSETVQASSDLLCWLLAGGVVPECAALNRDRIAYGMAKAADKLED